MFAPLKRRLAELHADHRRIALGAARVAFFLLMGKAVGAVKEMAVAYRYGVSDAVDAYQFTLTIASWLPVTLVGACSVVLIPALVRSRQDEPAQHSRFLGELQGWAWVLGAVAAVLLGLAWPMILDVAGQGLSSTVRDMSLLLILGFAPAAFFTVWTGLGAARLRAHERHINTLLDSVPALAILVCVLAAPAGAGVLPLLWGTLLGYAVQAVWQDLLARRADRVPVRPRLSRHAPQWSSLAAAAGIMLVGQLAMSFVGPLDQYTAAGLGANANATLGYAARLLSLMIGLTCWMEIARIVYSQILVLKSADFIAAAQMVGAPSWRIILRQILPNTLSPVLVAATLNTANAILLESYISFLGYGIQPPAASWGNMLTNAQSDFQVDPWLAVFPGIAITLAVSSFNFLGDGLRDALDPKIRDR